MIGLVLLICVAGVGALGFVALGRALTDHHRRRRDERAERAARRARTIPTPVPLPPGELTGVLALLDDSVRFTTVAPVVARRRLARGTTTPHAMTEHPQMHPIVQRPRSLPPPIPSRRK